LWADVGLAAVYRNGHLPGQPRKAVRALEWMFFRNSQRTEVIGAIALRVLGASQSRIALEIFQQVLCR